MSKGCSSVADDNRLASLAHLQLVALRAIPWVEYVEFVANLTDAPSRDGWDDKDVKLQLDSGKLTGIIAFTSLGHLRGSRQILSNTGRPLIACNSINKKDDDV